MKKKKKDFTVKEVEEFFLPLNKIPSSQMHALQTTVKHRNSNTCMLTLTADTEEKQQGKLHFQVFPERLTSHLFATGLCLKNNLIFS